MNGLRRRYELLSRSTKLWWGTGLFLAIGFSLTRSTTCLGFFFSFFLVLWVTPTVLWYVYRLWVRVTYSIGVRLFLSYLLIGVLPFPLIVGILAFAGYVVIGQYASSDYGDIALRVRDEMVQLVDDALDAGENQGHGAARELLLHGPRLPEDLRQVADHVEWIFASRGKVWHSADAAELPVPDWAGESVETGPFRHGAHAMLAAVARRGDAVAALVVPLNDATADGFSAGQWYRLRFPSSDDEDEEEKDRVDEDVSERSEERIEVRQEGTAAEDAETDESVDEPEAVAEDEDQEIWKGLWNNRWILFAHVGPEDRLWKSGRRLTGQHFTTRIRTSPREAATDLFTLPSDFRETLWKGFLITCSAFLLIYVGAVLMAAYYIFAITRAASRLTRGARQVQAGRLDYRIPVKNRDQLGDLAVAFNQMTESVAGMLDEVAEKERLRNELELAREIQQSLLPSRELRHGSIQVHAYFCPAAEVGGDYFDLFPLEPGRLIVMMGDVAGHGLSTGLLMAMVKSAVATLIQEGHRGVEILERVNHFMLQQPRKHRMVTLAIADVDVEKGVAEITNAAHPPVYLLGGSVREVMLPALPVGYRWPNPPPTERLELEEGSRLVFYSDGLVEAVDENEEQFGYDRLRQFLEDHAELDSETLLARLLKELEEYTRGRPPDDDLTLLIIDCGVGVGAETPPAAI